MKRINTEIINDIAKTINANPAELGLTKTSSLKKKVGILLDAVQEYKYSQLKTIDGYKLKREMVIKYLEPTDKKVFLDLIHQAISKQYEAIEATDKLLWYLTNQYINLEF